MSDKGFQFRTAAFGGFRKEDVLAYLEQSARAHTERVNALQRELKQAKAKGAVDEEQSTTLSDEVSKLREENERLNSELSAAVTRKNELEKLARQMQAELEKLRPSASAYEAVKERTAGIELEAHGRAQAIEDEGRRKAQELQEQVRQWFEAVSTAYSRMRGDMDATMGHASREITRTLENLQGLSGDLASQDQALEEIRKKLETPED